VSVGIYNVNNAVPFECYPGYEQRETAEGLDYLCTAIVEGRCYAFVGAGVSMRAGFPNWRTFIEAIAVRYQIEGTEDGPLIRGYIDRGDLITAAELIKNSSTMRQEEFNADAAQLFRSRLSRYTDDTQVYNEDIQPDDVHRFITRTAFQKIITTNYDNLLLEASRAAGIIPHEYVVRNADNFQTQTSIHGLVSTQPAVINIHGTCDEPKSMVITRKDYLDAYSGGFLINWLRNTLVQKSFLFVGYSLSDFDIVNLIKEAKATLPGNVSFGPHFAILDRQETSRAHREYLRGCYQIRAVADNIRHDPTVLRRLFAHIHGMCALKRAQMAPPGARLPESLFSTLKAVSESVRTDVGCDYVDIFVTDGIDKITLHRLCRCIGPETKIHPLHVNRPEFLKDGEQASELRRLFLSMRDNNYFYTPTASADDLANFAVCDVKGHKIKSLLVVPVSSQGKKVGLLVAGSVIEGAFTVYHHRALTIHTKFLAESYKSHLRKISVVQTALRGLQFDDVIRQLSTSRLLASLIESGQMRCILYAADYIRGHLVPYFEPPSNRAATWPSLPMGDPYLASDAASRGVTLHFQSKEEALDYVRSDMAVRRGLEYFDVTGNLYLTPIRSNGHISAVLVCWDNSYKDCKRYTQFERAKRIVRVMLNNYITSGTDELASKLFLRTLDEGLRQYDRGDIAAWAGALKKGDSDFMRNVIQSALATLVTPATGLTRVRLWVAAGVRSLRDIEKPRRSQTTRFRIMHSSSSPTTIRPGDSAVDKYVGVESSADDEYTQNTLDRYASDPYARVIDPLSTGTVVRDKNADALEKDEQGFWLTVPIVYRDRDPQFRKLRLMGFLSADSHRFQVSENRYVRSDIRLDSPQLAFQRCTLDLIAHLIAPLVRHLYFHEDRVFGD
jgi:hypothetical protein